MTPLTAPQRRVLAIVARHPSVALAEATSERDQQVNATVAGTLADRGLVTIAPPDMNTVGGFVGTALAATITFAGRSALDRNRAA